MKLSEALPVAPTHASPFQHKTKRNLISSSHAKVIFATDEWFARAENLLLDHDPVFVPDLYCSQGKVMDGWESRRRRTAGHDWCVIALNLEENDRQGEYDEQGRVMSEECKCKGGDVFGVELDTAYFTGNQTPRVSIQVANVYQQCYDRLDKNGDGDDDVYLEEEEWKYTWMPGSTTRLARGGGIQGTGSTISQIKRAERAMEAYEWVELMPMMELKPGYEETRMHYFQVEKEVREKVQGFTHVRVNYFPDGGVARLRLWGHEWDNNGEAAGLEQDQETREEEKKEERVTDAQSQSSDMSTLLTSAQPYHHPQLSSELNGAKGLSCSNKHYGVPSNLTRSTYGKDMGDGWETARHPDRPAVLIKDPKTDLVDSPLMDWAVLKLGMGGCSDRGVSRIIVDTKHFKGNFPESVKIEACDANGNGNDDANAYENDKLKLTDEIVCAATPESNDPCVKWFPVLHRTRMGPDREHVFDASALVNADRKVTHVRVSIFPDGGLSRVRIYGEPLDLASVGNDVEV